MSDTSSLIEHLNENIGQIFASQSPTIYNCYCPPIVFHALKDNLNLDNTQYNPLFPHPIKKDPEQIIKGYFEALGQIAENVMISPFDTLAGCIDLWEQLGPEMYNDFLNFQGLFQDCEFFKVHEEWAPFGIKIPAIIVREEDLQFKQTNLMNDFQLERFILGRNRRPKDLLIRAFTRAPDYLHVLTADMPELDFPNPFVEVVQGKIAKKTLQHAEEMKKNPELIMQKRALPAADIAAIASGESLSEEKSEKGNKPSSGKIGRPAKEKVPERLLNKIEDIPRKGWGVCSKRPFRILCRYFFSNGLLKKAISQQMLNKKFLSGQMGPNALRWPAANTGLKNYIAISDKFLKELRERFEGDPKHRETCKKLCESVQKRKDFLLFYKGIKRKPK